MKYTYQKYALFLLCLFSSAQGEDNESIFTHINHEPELVEAVKSQGLQHESAHIANKKKHWTIIIYMSADNDLAIFGRKNILQLARIGSNKYINILVQLDTKVQGNKKVTLRYYVAKNKLILTNFDDPQSQCMDSGKPETVIECFKWAKKNFPAEHYLLDFWNHGTGIIDIGNPRAINPSTLFSFNPQNSLFELDRTVPFLNFISLAKQEGGRGVCFDDSTGNYLTNQNIDYCLKTIKNDVLEGKKIDIVTFDACLMSMLEVANILKPHVDYMVSSQEVELGTGYDYYKALLPLTTKPLSPPQLAQHLVSAYHDTYISITRDFTQSALKLSSIEAIETKVSALAQLLIESLKNQQGSHIKKALQQSRHKLTCTHFEEPSYIDLHHWTTNLLANLSKFQFKDKRTGQRLIQGIKNNSQEILKAVEQTVIANATGKNVEKAKGISIYFPERHIHPSYHRTTFGKENNWLKFLNYYLLS